MLAFHTRSAIRLTDSLVSVCVPVRVRVCACACVNIGVHVCMSTDVIFL